MNARYTALLLFSLVTFPLMLCAEPLRIGHLTDLSGIGAMLGSQSEFGIQLAAKEIRAAGGQLEVYTSDHQMKLGQAATEATKLLTLNKVDVIVSDLTNPSLATVGIAEKAGKLFLCLSPSESIITGHKNSFRSFMDFKISCKQLSAYQKRKSKKVAFLGVFAEFSDLCLSGIKAEIPSVTIEQFNTGEDLRAQVLRLKSLGIDQISLIGFEQDALSAMRRAREIGLEAKFAMPSLYLTPLVISELKDALRGTLVYGFPPPDAAFIDRVKKVDPARSLQSIEYAALAYMHTYHIYEASKNCPTRSLACLMENLSKSASPSLLGFRGWKDRFAQFDVTLAEWDGNEVKALAF